MPRKKRNPAQNIETASNTQAIAIAEPKSPASLPPVERPAWVDGPPTRMAGEELTPHAPQKNWSDPYKQIFLSMTKGFEMGENRRFKQRVFIFRDKPEQSVLDTLKEHGFTYRPAEKAWTIPANPDTRRLSEELAHQFAGEAQGINR
jgi:hypothetical protein